MYEILKFLYINVSVYICSFYVVYVREYFCLFLIGKKKIIYMVLLRYIICFLKSLIGLFVKWDLFLLYLCFKRKDKDLMYLSEN